MKDVRFGAWLRESTQTREDRARLLEIETEFLIDMKQVYKRTDLEVGRVGRGNESNETLTQVHLQATQFIQGLGREYQREVQDLN